MRVTKIISAAYTSMICQKLAGRPRQAPTVRAAYQDTSETDVPRLMGIFLVCMRMALTRIAAVKTSLAQTRGLYMYCALPSSRKSRR